MVKRKSRGCRKPYALIGAIFHNSFTQGGDFRIIPFHIFFPFRNVTVIITRDKKSIHQFIKQNVIIRIFPNPLTGNSNTLIYLAPAYGKLKAFKIFFYIFHFRYFIDTHKIIGGNTKK